MMKNGLKNGNRMILMLKKEVQKENAVRCFCCIIFKQQWHIIGDYQGNDEHLQKINEIQSQFEDILDKINKYQNNINSINQSLAEVKINSNKIKNDLSNEIYNIKNEFAGNIQKINNNINKIQNN